MVLNMTYQWSWLALCSLDSGGASETLSLGDQKQ